jgi:hypothetical protein
MLQRSSAGWNNSGGKKHFYVLIYRKRTFVLQRYLSSQNMLQNACNGLCICFWPVDIVCIGAMRLTRRIGSTVAAPRLWGFQGSQISCTECSVVWRMFLDIIRNWTTIPSLNSVSSLLVSHCPIIQHEII